MRHLAWILAAWLLAGCADRAQQAADVVQDAVQDATHAAQDPITDAQAAIAEALVPATLALEDAVQVAIEPLPGPVGAVSPPTGPTPAADPAVALIVRWEVTSRDAYMRQYQGVICPGGASGPTVGIGYDLGHQTTSEIRRALAWHPEVERLATASGHVGPGRCADWRAANRDIRVSWDQALRLFETDSLPVYTALAARAFGPSWAALDPYYAAGMKSLGYNRGWGMSGPRNTEKRVIVARCAPARDKGCAADQLIAMCRLWPETGTTRGLCPRRKDEARVVRIDEEA